jgi:signal peptidase II
LNNRSRNFVILFLVASIVLGLDQWTKLLVRTHLVLGDTWLPAGWGWLAPYARILYIYNTGIAFGSFQGNNGWVFIVIAVLVTAGVLYYLYRSPETEWWVAVAMGLLVGGALGNNLFDRLLVGKVTDFISVGNFWIFNIADMSINLCVAMMLIGLWLLSRAEKNKAGEDSGLLEEV